MKLSKKKNISAISLTETIISLLLVSVITFVYLYKDFKFKDNLEQISFTQQLIRDLQLTTSLAINYDIPYKLSFNNSNFNYAISDLNNNYYTHEVFNTNIISYPSDYISVSIDPIEYNPIYFLNSGIPAYYNTNTNNIEPISNNAIINITYDITNNPNNIGSKIIITAQTGYIY